MDDVASPTAKVTATALAIPRPKTRTPNRREMMGLNKPSRKATIAQVTATGRRTLAPAANVRAAQALRPAGGAAS